MNITQEQPEDPKDLKIRAVSKLKAKLDLIYASTFKDSVSHKDVNALINQLDNTFNTNICKQ